MEGEGPVTGDRNSELVSTPPIHMFTDDQVIEIYQKTSQNPGYSSERKDRALRLQRFQTWLGKIASGTDSALLLGFRDHFKNSWQTLNAINRDGIVQDLGRFRETVSTLLDENQPLVSRIDRVLDGPLHLRGFAKGHATDYLMIAYPDRYCLWNEKTVSGLKALDRMPTFQRGQSSGERYRTILEVSSELRYVTGSPSFPDLDQFLHYVGAPEPEGLHALQAVIAVATVPGGGPGTTTRPGPFGSSAPLPEGSYERFSPRVRQSITPLHNALSNDISRALCEATRSTPRRVGVVDLILDLPDEQWLLELKVCYGGGTRHAIREAVGQVAEYALHPEIRRTLGDSVRDRARRAVVLDTRPSSDDLEYLTRLNDDGLQLGLMWLELESLVGVSLGETQLASILPAPKEPSEAGEGIGPLQSSDIWTSTPRTSPHSAPPPPSRVRRAARDPRGPRRGWPQPTRLGTPSRPSSRGFRRGEGAGSPP